MTSSNHILPRRRTSRGLSQDTAVPTLGSQACTSDKSSALRKGATFHSPASPSTPTDPTLSIDNLPRRSLTSPKDLEALVLESKQRVEELITDLDQRLSLSTDAAVKISRQDVLPVPSAFLAHTVCNANLQDIVESRAQRRSKSKKHSGSVNTSRQTDYDHDSDSGLGSSISSDSLCEEPSEDDDDQTTGTTTTPTALSAGSVFSPLKGTYSAFHKTFSSKADDHCLDLYATSQIKKYIVDPLLKEEEFKEYHSLLEDVPKRISSKKITCLRALEKTLIFLAEFKAKSPSSYLVFCNTAIQSIHTTVGHLNDSDLRRPTDRPYTNNYFVDLVEQVRQYARIMAVTRQKKADGQSLNGMDHTEDEKLQLRVEDGKPAELVRERADGKVIPIEAGRKQSADVDEDDMIIDADVERSMARKRKCDIGKVEYRTCRECDAVFTRACDLTKHEKTHSRPWKCPEPDCRYHSDGWPTEKERDRHVNDKHSKDASLFKCLYEPCTYSSKRESNCKQHMEKAHGWEYVRAKSKKGQNEQKLVPTSTSTKLIPSAKVPKDTSLPTPASSVAFPSLSTPSSIMSNSPATLSDQSFSPASENDYVDDSTLQLDHTMSGTESAFNQSIFRSNQMLEEDPMFINNWGGNMSYNSAAYTPPDCPDLLNTPDTGYTDSPTNFAIPNNFDFNNFDNFNSYVDEMDTRTVSTMREFFPTWFSDNSSGDSGLTDQSFPAMKQNFNHQGDFTYAGQQELYSSNQYSTADMSPGNAATNNDFTLYSNDTGLNTHVNNNFSGSMFPDLDFGSTPEETIYDDVLETDTRAKTSDDVMMEQWMNLDSDGQAQGQ